MSWNINGFANRKILLQQYILEHSVDIAMLQECRSEPDNFNIPGYKCFIIPSTKVETDNNITYWRRGLATYVKDSIPAKTSPPISLGSEEEELLVTCHTPDGTIIAGFQNSYVCSYRFEADVFAIQNKDYPLIIMGDLNADIRDNGKKTNCNGYLLKRYLSSEQCPLRDVGPEGSTHSRGGRLDIALTNIRYRHHKSGLADTLLSDHSGIYLEIEIPDSGYVIDKFEKKRFSIPKKSRDTILENLNNWYKDYEPTNADDFNTDICERLESEIEKCETKYRPPMTSAKRWYNSDPTVKRGKKQFRKLRKVYDNSPTSANLDTLKRMEKQLGVIMKSSREKYWIAMLQTINERTPPAIVAKKVVQVSGKKKREELNTRN